LGGTLFYLLAGRAPFAEHKSLFSKLEAHRSQPPKDVRTLRPDVPVELAAFLHRLLAKKPEERFATAAEVAAALAPFAGDSQPRSEQTNRPRTNRAAQILALVGGMALLGFLTLLVGIGSSPPRSAATTKPDTESPQPIRLTLEVVHKPALDRFLEPAKLGTEVYHTRFGDAVMVTARMALPAFGFLIAFRPDGKTEGLFPEKEDQEVLRQESMVADYVLNDGAGLEAFAAVASSQPLPPFKDWWKRSQGCPWGKFEGTPGMVWRADGVKEPEDFYESGRSKPKGKTDRQAVKELADWLRQTPGIEKVQVWAFTVEKAKR
jgi:hypothetical protein